MTTAKFGEIMAQVRAGVLKGAGIFGVGYSTLPEGQAPFVLVLGAIKASTTHGQIRDSRGGYIVTLGMTTEHVIALRDQCNELLAEGKLDARLAAGEKGIAKIPDSPETRHGEPEQEPA